MNRGVHLFILLLQCGQNCVNAVRLASTHQLRQDILVGHADQARGLRKAWSQFVQRSRFEIAKLCLTNDLLGNLSSQIDALHTIQRNYEAGLTVFLQDSSNLTTYGLVGRVNGCQDLRSDLTLRVVEKRSYGQCEM